MSAKGTDAMDVTSSPETDEWPRARQRRSQRLQLSPRMSSHSPESVAHTKRLRSAPVLRVSEKVPKSRSTASRAMMTPIQEILNENNVGIAQDHSSGSDRAFSGSSTRDSRAGPITTTMPTIISQSNISRSNDTLQTSTGCHQASIHLADQPWSALFQYDTSAARKFDSGPIPENPLDNGRARSLLQNRESFTGEVQANAEGVQVPSAHNTESSSGSGSSRATSLPQAFSTASEGDVIELQPATHSFEGTPVQLHVANSVIPLGQLDWGKSPLAMRPTKRDRRARSRSNTNRAPSPSQAYNSTATAMKPRIIARGLRKSRAADEHTCDLFGQGRYTGQSPLHTSSDKDSTENKQAASRSMYTRRLPHASPTKKQRAHHRKAEKKDASPHPSAVGLLQRKTANAPAGGQRRSAGDSRAPVVMPRFTGHTSELDDDGPLFQQASLRRAFSFWLAGFTMAAAGSMSLSHSSPASLLYRSPTFLPLTLARPAPQPCNAFCGTVP